VKRDVVQWYFILHKLYKQVGLRITADHWLADAAAYVRADAACSLTRWQHFSAWNYIMTTNRKVWRRIGNLTCRSMRQSYTLHCIVAVFGDYEKVADFGESPTVDEALGFSEDVAPTRTRT